MKIDGLFINKLLSRFKDGQAFLVIQNTNGKDVGTLNLRSIGLSETFKNMRKTNRNIEFQIKLENKIKEEQVRNEILPNKSD